MKRSLFLQILFATALIVPLVLQSCSAGGNSGSEAATPTPVPTTAAFVKATYTVQRGEVVGTVTFTGRIAPVNQKPLFFPIDGRVGAVYVQEGDPITAGTVIADLEGAADLKRQLEINQINLQRSQIHAEIAQMNFDLFLAQTPKGSSIYETRLAIEQAKLELAKLDVQQASLGIEDLQDSLLKTQLIAPMDGEVIELQISAGSQVRAYNFIGSVADVTQLEVSATITDVNILDKLQVGMTAVLVPSSGLGKPGTGSVRRLSLSSDGGQLSAQDKSVRIALDLPPADSGYKMGDLMDVTVTVVKKEDVLWIPPQAIRTYSGRNFVVVQDGDVQIRVDVKLGVIGEDRVEIVEGLNAGQVVVSP